MSYNPNVRGFHNLESSAGGSGGQSGGYRAPSGVGYQPGMIHRNAFYPLASRCTFARSARASAVAATAPVVPAARSSRPAIATLSDLPPTAVASSNRPGGSVIYGAAESGPTISLLSAPPTNGEAMGSIKDRIFPRAKLRSFTAVISLIQCVMFIATLIVGASKFDGAIVKGNQMLGPSAITFFWMGGKWEPSIREGHIWRLVTPVLLHGGFIHLLSNLFFQCRYGFSLEVRWSIPRFVGVYFATCIGASLFSCICGPRGVGVGASGALFGLTGADLTYLAINWNDIPDNKQELCMMLCLIGVNLLMGLSGDIDNYAHLGGLITGLVIGGWILIHATPREDKIEKAIKFGSIALTAVWFVLLICLLWAANPDPELNSAPNPFFNYN